MQTIQRRRTIRLLVIAALLVGLTLAPLQVAAAQTGTPLATVTAPVLNVRAGPSPGYDAVTTVREGESVWLLGRTPDSAYVHVRTRISNIEGWISSFYITPLIPLRTLPIHAEAEPWGQLTGTVSLRTGPGTAYPRIGVLANGLYVGVLGRSADSLWVYLRVANQADGWISSGYVVPSVSFRSLPVIGADTAPTDPGTDGTGGLPPSGGGRTAVIDGIEVLVGEGDIVITEGVSTNYQRVEPWASPSSDGVAFIDEGTPLLLLGRDQYTGWIYVMWNGHSLGWVEAKYVDSDFNLEKLTERFQDGLPTGTALGAAEIEEATGGALTVGATPTDGTDGGVVPDDTDGGVVPGGTAPVDAPTVVLGTGVVNTGVLNVRTAPSANQAILTQLGEGTQVGVIARDASGAWAYVSLASGGTGWVNFNFLLSALTSSDLPVTNTVVQTDMYGVAMVATPVLNVRQGPSTFYASVGTVSQSQIVNLLGRNERSSWVKIRTLSGLEGWVASGEIIPYVPFRVLPVLSTSPTGATGTATVTGGALNMRTGPGVTYTSIAVLPQGMTLSVVGRNSSGSWVKVRTSAGLEGWVSSGNVTMDVPLSSLPVVA